jgi:hypothetical protein
MNEFKKTIAFPHLDSVELQDWDFVPNAITQNMQLSGVHMDAGESMIFALQLQHIRTQVLERPYPENKARRLIPQQAESPAGAEEFAYVVADQVGMFELITNYSDDLPLTDVKGEKEVVSIAEFGGACHYSVNDVERANMAGVALTSRKMVGNRDAAERKFEKIAWQGDAKAGLFGMLTVPNATKETAATKVLGGTQWQVAGVANASALEVYADLVRPKIQQIEDTNEIESPNVYVMSLADIEYANTQFFDDSTGQSALARFKINHPEITIESSVYMKGAGAGVTNVILAYRNDSMKVAMETPLPYNVMAPQFRNLVTIINARLRTAGVVAYFPLSITIIEGL